MSESAEDLLKRTVAGIYPWTFQFKVVRETGVWTYVEDQLTGRRWAVKTSSDKNELVDGKWLSGGKK